MNHSTAAGAALVASTPIINATASAVGIAGTGTAIGALTGAAHTSATAAWIGLGSMKAGMFLMGAMPVIGVLLILDGISGKDHGSPIIDWYEEAWRQYEIQAELEELKKEVEVDSDHQLRAKTRAASFAHQDAQFHALEVEHELYLLKKAMGFDQKQINNKAEKLSDRALIEFDYNSFNVLDIPNVGLKVRIAKTGFIGFIVAEYFDMKANKHMLQIKAIGKSYSTYAALSDVSLIAASE